MYVYAIYAETRYTLVLLTKSEKTYYCMRLAVPNRSWNNYCQFHGRFQPKLTRSTTNIWELLLLLLLLLYMLTDTHLFRLFEKYYERLSVHLGTTTCRYLSQPASLAAWLWHMHVLLLLLLLLRLADRPSFLWTPRALDYQPNMALTNRICTYVRTYVRHIRMPGVL